MKVSINVTTATVVYTCEHCGQVVENEDELRPVYTDLYRPHYTENWCDECIGNDATTCDRCGDIVALDAVTTVRVSSGYYGGTVKVKWCPNCAEDHSTECEDCGERYENSLIESYDVWREGWQYICDDCRRDHYSRCESCGDLVHDEEIIYHERSGSYYCPDCYEDHHCSENLAGYHHTLGDTFWFDDKTSKRSYSLTEKERDMLFLGLELETDYNDCAEDLADDIAGEYDTSMIECKEDGSLNDEGVEIVSQPMTPLFHLTSGVWERIVDMVIRHGGRSHDAGSCGLHIHLSRNYFTNNDAVYRLDRIFHRFSAQLLNFSRRSEESMRHWCNIGEDDLAEIEDVNERKEKWYAKKSWAGRYEAVNNTNPSTVEIRLWRGTLNMETIRATIELTAGLAIVANSMSDELADTLTWRMLLLLIRFALEQNGIPRTDLDAYLVRRHLA